MSNTKPTFDAMARIEELAESVQLPLGKFALECGLAENTLRGAKRRGTQPSLPTIMAVCDFVGITITEFMLSDEDTPRVADA